jgi:hypothetical protein
MFNTGLKPVETFTENFDLSVCMIYTGKHSVEPFLCMIFLEQARGTPWHVWAAMS